MGRRPKIALVAVAVVLLGALAFVGWSGDEVRVVPDGDWELVRLDYDGRQYEEPLFLRSADGLIGGHGACNNWGEEPDGQISQTLVGCGVRLERIDDALHAAAQGDRRIDGAGHLFLEATGIRAEYRPVDRVSPSDLFAILDSDLPDVDPANLLFDAEGGPPVGWDRIIALEDTNDVAEFHIGSTGEMVCFHVGLATPRETASYGCREARELSRSVMLMAAGFPVQKVRAALIPDIYLDPPNAGLLEDLGTLHGNLFVPDGTNELVFSLAHFDQDAIEVRIPALVTDAG